MKSKKKIEWLTKSPSMITAFDRSNKEDIRGGRKYELLAMDALKNNYVVSINKSFKKKANLTNYIFQNHKAHIQGDLCIVDPYIVGLGKFSTKVKNISIIHHIDENLFNRNILYKIFYKNLKRNLKKMNAIVVVSDVWKTFLNNMGIGNVKVIYNAFNVNEYVFSEQERQAFKHKYNLSLVKPIVYIGPNIAQKGFSRILKTIDKKKYEVITTGKIIVNQNDVKSFFFSDYEFRLFLSCCDLVLCMSTMSEGWNRIAHESLLTKTPVIGSGSGGMRELLEKSGQIILGDTSNLNKSIDYCLDNSEEFIKTGHEYVIRYTLDDFNFNWNSLVKNYI